MHIINCKVFFSKSGSWGGGWEVCTLLYPPAFGLAYIEFIKSKLIILSRHSGVQLADFINNLHEYYEQPMTVLSAHIIKNKLYLNIVTTNLNKLYHKIEHLEGGRGDNLLEH